MSNIKRNPTDNPVIDRIEEALKNNKKTKKEMLSYLVLLFVSLCEYGPLQNLQCLFGAERCVGTLGAHTY